MAHPIRLRDNERDWTIDMSGSTVTIDDTSVVVTDAGDGRWRVTANGTDRTGVAAIAADDVWVEIEGEIFEFHVAAGTTPTNATRGRDALTPPMSATVVRVAATSGQHVAQGDTLVVLEAMKMELPIRAPFAGIIKALHCAPGDLVQPGTLLVDLEDDNKAGGDAGEPTRS